MTIDRALPPLEIAWADEAIALRIQVDQEGIARLVQLSARVAGGHGKAASGDGEGAHPSTAASFPLVDVVSSATGRGRSGRRYVDSVVGSRLRYLDHAERIDGPWRELLVRLEDPETGLTAHVVYRLLGARCVFRSHVLLTNGGSVPVTIESVTSFLGSGLAGPQGSLDDVDIMFGENDWLAENRWHCRPFRDALPDVKRSAHGGDSRARFGLTGAGSWSSGTYLPMGAAVNRRTGHTWIWQIEHDGGWHWQVGEHSDRGSTSKRGGHALRGCLVA
jgi:alpha-galactosidase